MWLQTCVIPEVKGSLTLKVILRTPELPALHGPGFGYRVVAQGVWGITDVPVGQEGRATTPVGPEDKHTGKEHNRRTLKYNGICPIGLHLL